MVNSNLDLSGGSAKKKKPGVLPPSTLPKPALRPLNAAGGTPKAPAELDPAPMSGGTPAAAAKSPSSGGVYSVPEEAAPSAASSAAGAGADLDFHMPAEDEEARLRYESALAELERLRGVSPRYDSRYDAQIRDLYEQITARGPFRYDSAADPLYQQYRQDYTSLGRMAMRDTMGQAAALTGGYGSSYAQSAGQQQYDAYLRRLADVLPETYGMALDAWQAEGQELQRRYAAAGALEQRDYERYLDELGQYNRSVESARSDADTAYARMRADEERAYERAADDYARRLAADERAYRRAKDAASAAPRSAAQIIVRTKSSSSTGAKKKSSGHSGKRSL